MTKLVTTDHKVHSAKQILESLTEPSNTAYYLFTSDHTTHSNSTLQPLYDREKTYIDAYRNMIFGKRVTSADVKLMIRNIPYVSNTVYTMYDDSNELILSQDYYVIVNATSNYHVYKCLDNNSNGYSTVEPNFAHISGSNTYVYETSDGYRWKYMYTVDSANVVKFETTNYFPLIANATVSNSAIAGAIDIIKITGAGKGYDNYVTGQFAASELKIGGNELIYKISNTVVSTVNGFYTNTILYISDGTGVGQYKTVTDYYSNSIGNYITVNSAFSTSLDNTSEYQIYPKVHIIGGGEQTVNAEARAIVNSTSSNSIYKVEMLNRGAGYTYHTATVLANSTVGVSEVATLRPIYGPYRGHGYDAASELGAKYISFSVKVSNSEGNTILTDNKFQQIGILRDPLFANVEVELKNTNGTFTAGETIYKIKPVRLNTNATMNTSSNVVTCSSADFANQISVGDWLYLNSGNGTSHQIINVSSVTNSSSLVLASNGSFACTETIIYAANITSNAVITSANVSHIFVTNVSGQLVSNDIFVGMTSGAKAQVNTISRNANVKNYDTFLQLYKYTGTLDSGSFEENEIIYQGNSTTSNALVFSSNVETGVLTVYTSNQVGQFIADGANVVVGANSGTIASFTNAYSPELVFGSGEILFLENIEAVTRNANTNETFQIIFEY